MIEVCLRIVTLQTKLVANELCLLVDGQACVLCDYKQKLSTWGGQKSLCIVRLFSISHCPY